MKTKRIKKPQLGTIENPYLIKQTYEVIVAVVDAKHWFADYTIPVFTTALRDDDFVVARWFEYYMPKGKKDISGRNTLGIFHDYKLAERFFNICPIYDDGSPIPLHPTRDFTKPIYKGALPEAKSKKRK